MRSFFHRFSNGLAFFPGLLAGWLVAAGVPGSADDASPDLAHLPAKRIVAPAANSDTSKNAAHAMPGSAKIRMASGKLDILRHSRCQLKLDFQSFADEANSTTESAFQIFREVIDLTPSEEKALRKALSQGSEALRAYERSHLTGFTVSPERISFRLPPMGEFQEQLVAGIRRSEIEILGEERATIFQAIARTESFCDLPPAFGGAVEFVANPGEGHFQMNLDGAAFRTVFISADSPTEHVFGRFDYLIDSPSKLGFCESLGGK